MYIYMLYTFTYSWRKRCRKYVIVNLPLMYILRSCSPNGGCLRAL